MSDIVIVKIIDEVREITAEQVAKKQDAAVLNFANIIEKIKAQAQLGNSSCTLFKHEMNEYDKKLLEQEGFLVRPIDQPNYPDDRKVYLTSCDDVKMWEIKW